jgi:hypothetical protein
MSRRPQNGETNWGTALNAHLDVALDEATGKVKPQGIQPGSTGQVLVTDSNGTPTWGDAQGGNSNTTIQVDLLTQGGYDVSKVSRYTDAGTYNVTGNGILVIGYIGIPGGTYGVSFYASIVNPDESVDYRLTGGSNGANTNGSIAFANSAPMALPIYVPKDWKIKIVTSAGGQGYVMYKQL